MMLRGKYKNRKTLETLCGLNIAVNLGTSLTFILVYV
jgi:1,4-dihydroxy-2-naphthoate polyprenyltransferase